MAVSIPSTPNVRKNESKYTLLAWVNTTLQSQFEKVEELCTGAAYCNLTEILFPGSIPMNRVKLWTKLEHDFINNFKILQNTFKNLGVNKVIPVHMIIQGKPSVNLEFLQWFKQFFDANYRGHSYNAVAARDGYPIGYGNACQLKKDVHGRSILYSHSPLPDNIHTDFKLNRDSNNLRIIVTNKDIKKNNNATANGTDSGEKTAVIKNLMVTLDIPLPEDKSSFLSKKLKPKKMKRYLSSSSEDNVGSNGVVSNMIDMDKILYQRLKAKTFELRKTCEFLINEWHKKNLQDLIINDNSDEQQAENHFDKEYFEKLLYEMNETSQSCETIVMDLNKTCILPTSTESDGNFNGLYKKQGRNLIFRNISDIDEASLSSQAEETWSEKPCTKNPDSGVSFCETGRQNEEETITLNESCIENIPQILEELKQDQEQDEEQKQSNVVTAADITPTSSCLNESINKSSHELNNFVKKDNVKKLIKNYNKSISSSNTNNGDNDSKSRFCIEQGTKLPKESDEVNEVCLSKLQQDTASLLEDCEYMINEKSHLYSNLRDMETTCYETESYLCQSLPLVNKLNDIVSKVQGKVEQNHRNYLNNVEMYEFRKISNQFENIFKHPPKGHNKQQQQQYQHQQQAGEQSSYTNDSHLSDNEKFQYNFGNHLSMMDHEEIFRIKKEHYELKRMNDKMLHERENFYEKICENEKITFQNDLKVSQVFPYLRKIFHTIAIVHKQLKKQRLEYDECIRNLEYTENSPHLVSRLFSDIYITLYKLSKNGKKQLFIDDIQRMTNQNIHLKQIYEKMSNDRMKFLTDINLLNENYTHLESKLNEVLPLIDRLYYILHDFQNGMSIHRCNNHINLTNIAPAFVSDCHTFDDLIPNLKMKSSDYLQSKIHQDDLLAASAATEKNINGTGKLQEKLNISVKDIADDSNNNIVYDNNQLHGLVSDSDSADVCQSDIKSPK